MDSVDGTFDTGVAHLLAGPAVSLWCCVACRPQVQANEHATITLRSSDRAVTRKRATLS